MMTKLAIHGGTPVRTTPFPTYNTIGDAEKRAVMEVLDSGVLSGFMATWGDAFYGGPKVRQLEAEWAAYFGVKHAISVNSATSGLYAAVGAARIQPGDEVIVTPYSMIASATAAVVYGGIPVFADIDEDIFCITPESIRANITPHTKAIIVVDLFGHPADMDEIMQIAEEHNLVVIEDAAQAIGATYKGRYAGTLGHIGVYSLNYHKQIHCGEGGVVVTDDDDLADRVRLIRNHAEVVVGDAGVGDITNMIGYNYRMGEMEAAIAIEQLKKLRKLNLKRVDRARYLDDRLFHLMGITIPASYFSVWHAYYLYAMRYNADIVGVPRSEFVAAVRAEGVPLWEGYVKPIYREPLYRNCRHDCPVTERMHFEELVYTNCIHANITRTDLDDFCEAIRKVYEYYGRA